MEKTKKCIFCDWEKIPKVEEDKYDWVVCPRCKIKCGLENEK